ncbi:hypothetical protein ASF39_13615 [Methylobacterium sp. Leaf108]|nr:hypothetical protein ASF39_13615 [Methylobacterium sp. Leaf108]
MRRAPVAVAPSRRRILAEVPPVGRFRDDGRGDRLARIRAAEEAGYLVIRSRTIELPDGRRLRSYAPYEGEDADD